MNLIIANNDQQFWDRGSNLGPFCASTTIWTKHSADGLICKVKPTCDTNDVVNFTWPFMHANSYFWSSVLCKGLMLSFKIIQRLNWLKSTYHILYVSCISLKSLTSNSCIFVILFYLQDESLLKVSYTALEPCCWTFLVGSIFLLVM